MTISVTMLQTRMGEDGTLWTVAGSPYDASLDFAYYLIGAGFATGILPTAMQSYPMTQLVATAAEIAALSGQPGVLYVERDGDQRMFRWNGLAMEEVGAGAASSGSTASQSTPPPLTALQVVNTSGSAASYIVRQPGEFRYGGFLVESGSALVTVRHGIVVGADIIYSNTVAPSGYNRLVEPLDLSEGLYVTLSANGRVTFFVSDNEALDLDDGLPPETGPIAVPMAATGRAWLGRGTYRGLNLNTQTTAGSGVKVYDGWDDTGPLVDVIASSVVGFMAGAPAPEWPVSLRHGCYIELLGTGQAANIFMGERA